MRVPETCKLVIELVREAMEGRASGAGLSGAEPPARTLRSTHGDLYSDDRYKPRNVAGPTPAVVCWARGAFDEDCGLCTKHGWILPVISFSLLPNLP